MREEGLVRPERFIDKPIDPEELIEAVQEIVDMPDRKIDLFIRFCLQNSGRLSARKRTSHFDFLSDEEVARMEQAVQSAYGNTTPGSE